MQQYIGMRLGGYQVVEQIGQGGMATVCKAYQPSMDRYVAIKILPSYFTEDKSFVGRFTQEARTLARLEHPHILPVYDYGEQEGITYLVMRYVEAGTLKDLIRREDRIDVKEAARIVGQVADALGCGHSQGVIHRDIKPSNVLIDQYGNTFLTDFGIAKLVAETAQFTASGAIIGTPAYMSPEQGMGQPVDARTDIYSLGVVLYELVTARVPFQAETPLAVLLKHLNAPLPPPRQIRSDLPPAVERVILKAMAKQLDDRYQTVQELMAALRQAAAEAPEVHAVPQPPEDQLDETVQMPHPSPPPPVVAPEALAEQRCQAELDDLHSQAVEAMDAGEWAQARDLLAEIQEREPGYRGAERLLDRADAELEQAEADRRRRVEVASLYKEAQSLARDRQWRPALAKMDEIQALDAEFADPEGIGAWAREQAAAEEAEAQRQNELSTLYAEAVRLLKAGQYQEALQKWDEVQAIDPGYRDRKKLQATARRELARLSEPATKRRLPHWVRIAAGTVAVAAMAVAAVLILRTLSTAPPTPRRIPSDLGAGSVWKWSDGSAMVYVPAGTFWMGTDENDPDANWDEVPQQLLNLDAFWIDRAEVTNAQYERCVRDGGCSPPSETTTHIYGDYHGESAYDDYPIIHVRWEQAKAYCAWAGKRLPTEAEWEKAARGTDKRIYPWGNEFDGSLANFCDDRCTFPQKDSAWDDGYASTAPVGSYEGGASPYGAWDMAGNVHEWTSSLDWTYPYDAMDGREDAETAGPRVVRGGSLGCDPWTVRTVQRHRVPPASIQIDLGFRCIQSAAEPLAQGSAPAQPLTAPTGPTRTATQTAETASGEAHHDLGISLLEHGEYKEALAQFDQALALGAETPDLYYLRSQACSKWPREVGGCGLEQAIADVTKAIKLDPSNREYWFARGTYHLDRANQAAAFSDLDKAVELDPGFAVAYAERGSALMGMGELDRAVESFEKALELDPPNEANYYFERGRAYAQLGQVAEARADYEAYLRRTEGEPNAEHRGDAEQWLEQNPVSARPLPVRTTTAAPTETAAPITAAVSATLRPTATQQPATDTPRPTRTPAPTPLPGTEVIPISQMAAAIPWLPPGRGRAVQTISFNVTKAPFNDRRIRQAFSLAVNRATVAKVVGSYGVSDPRAATTFTPPEVLGRDLYRQVGLVYDPGLARESLAEAGYPNGDGFPQVTLVSNRTEVYEALTNTVVDMWRQELGVTVNVELLDGQDAWRDRLFGDTPEVFRVGWNSWSTNRDPNVLEIFRSEHELNFAHFSSSRYDRLIDEAAALAEDPAARQALYIEAERILCQEEAVIIPLYHPLTE